MKKIFLNVMAATLLGGITLTATAQQDKTKDKVKGKNGTREVIIMRDTDKDTKLTIETKDGEVFINGKPASEYKDDNVQILPGKDGRNFIYSPKGNMRIFDDNDWKGEKKAFLGVSTEKADKGVKVTNVDEGSAADKAGIKEGDIITKFGDKKIEDPEDLTEAVTSRKPKDEVNVTYEREGKSNSTKAALGEQSGWKSFAFNGPDFKLNNDWSKDFNKDFAQGFSRSFNSTEPFSKITGPNGQGFRYLFSTGKRLGIRVEDTEDDNGAKITNVEKESAAEKAGLKKDDILTEVGGKKVKNVKDVLDEVKANAEKNSYSVKAKRNRSEMSFDIKIPKKKNNADL